MDISWGKGGRHLGEVQGIIRRAFPSTEEETKMKWELIIVALFWLVYGPVSFAIWGSTSSHLSTLVAILTAGIMFTATFLGGRLLMQYFKARKYKALIKEKMDVLDQLQQEEIEQEVEETEEVSEAPAPQVQQNLD